MQLTMYSDYSLRILLHLAAHKDRLIPLTEITTLHNVSHHHLVKVVQNLVAQGYVRTIRGKSGGMQLAMDAEILNIGAVVRTTEPHMNLLECFDQKTNTCPLTDKCRLKGVLYQARKNFMDTLDAYTLADML
ncbi:MAG: Rrf2 family transcriptional regulator [Mariprofundaceae bacterium]|nr:Rrf2 family transcriptional regulator [Mariprofundaceae bacterium]